MASIVREPFKTYPASTVQESLTEAEALEYRRRYDTTMAIVILAREKFTPIRELKQTLKERRAARAPIWWFWGAVIFGAVLHYFFKDPGKSFEFTFGSFVLLAAGVWYAAYCYDTFRMEEALKKATDYQSELLYRWLANGGGHDAFWTLRDLTESDADMSDWWAHEKAHLLGSATGKSVVPG